jgi:hypothetical protein
LQQPRKDRRSSEMMMMMMMMMLLLLLLLLLLQCAKKRDSFPEQITADRRTMMLWLQTSDIFLGMRGEFCCR